MYASAFLIFVYIAVVLLGIVGTWFVFMKAGESGWKSIVPIWNLIVLLRIVGRPAWWVVLAFIPFVNIIAAAFIAQDLARSFGKSGLFAVGLWLLSFIFIPILGFGSATYQGPAGPEGQAWGEGSIF